MSQNRQKEAYPILDGKALIRVSLNGKQEENLWYEKLSSRIKYHIVKNQAQAYSPFNNDGSFAIVSLNSRRDSSFVSKSNLELNLAKDEMPLFGKFKLALGGVVTAGLILMSTWGAAKSEGSNIMGTSNSGLNMQQTYSSDIHREKSAVMLSETGNESILLASLMQPGDSHPFQKIGHTNLAPTAHTNADGSIVHTNTDAYADLTPHSNIFPSEHANTHTNQGHTNTSDENP
jgi:hypothetical protein